MALLEFRADYGDGDSTDSSLSTEKGYKAVLSLRDSAIAQPLSLDRPFCSAEPNGLRLSNVVAPRPVSHGSDWSGRMSNPMLVERELAHEREMTNNGVRANIMSVELAIQRELAYQKKIERMQSQPCNDFQERPIPSQGMPSNLKLVGMKRKAQSDDLSCLPPQPPQQSYSQQPPQIQSVNLFCKVCQVFCTSTFNLKQHCKGKKHKAKLEELESQKNGEMAGTKLVWCDVCRIPCMNELCFWQHLAGKKHNACLQAINNARTAGGKEAEEIPIAKWEELEWETVS